MHPTQLGFDGLAPRESSLPEQIATRTGLIFNFERGDLEADAPRQDLGDSRGGRRRQRRSTVTAKLSHDGVDLGAVQNFFLQ